jgi:hypothetical protein
MPDAFKFLPEYVLEDITTNFKFIFDYVPDIMISAVGNDLIALCITFLTNSEYVKNPYLKAKLVTILFHGTWPVFHRKKGVIGDALAGEKFANDHLLHALMKFYIGKSIRHDFFGCKVLTVMQRLNLLAPIPSSMISSTSDTKSSKSSSAFGQMISTSSA